MPSSLSSAEEFSDSGSLDSARGAWQESGLWVGLGGIRGGGGLTMPFLWLASSMNCTLYSWVLSAMFLNAVLPSRKD